MVPCNSGEADIAEPDEVGVKGVREAAQGKSLSHAWGSGKHTDARMSFQMFEPALYLCHVKGPVGMF